MVSSKQNGTCCSAYGCKRKFNQNGNVRFHLIPLKIGKCFKKWLAVMTREEFVPTKHSRIYGDHITSLDCYPSSFMLLKTSIPSGFDFPQHLEMVVTERKQLKRKSPHIEGDCK